MGARARLSERTRPFVQCRFTSTDTTGTVRDGEPT